VRHEGLIHFHGILNEALQEHFCIWEFEYPEYPILFLEFIPAVRAGTFHKPPKKISTTIYLGKTTEMN